MALMIEVCNRQGKVTERLRVTGDRVRLGRAFDNDVILQDPHIEPYHAQLQRQADGQWLLVDLGSLNGTTVRQKPVQQQLLPSGQSFQLVDQEVRMFDERHPVPPAQPINKAQRRLALLGHPLQLLLWVLCIAALDMAQFWLNNGAEDELRWQQQLVQFPLSLLAISIWPACLMIWSRYNQQHGYFRAQLALTLLAVLSFELWQGLEPVLLFSWNAPDWFYWLDQAVTAAIVGGLLLANFTLALQSSRWRRYLYVCGLVLLFSGQSLVQRLWSEQSPRLAPSYDQTVLPLPFYLNRPLDNNHAIDQSADLFRQADKLRQEGSAEPSSD